MPRLTIAAAAVFAMLALGGAVAQDGPATELDRMSWDEPCAAIRDHLTRALEANAEIPAATRAEIDAQLARSDPGAERAACLAPLKAAYDRLVAAYEATSASANILGGATDAPQRPSKVHPESVEGKRTGERIGGD
ncbi:MAG: hypothetical protein GVY33_04895 [Alphaproteobacteria bacterium]|jgi:hypothetical protein|nr:hypothetical protein [Alphaproteobacteria bacterium]